MSEKKPANEQEWVPLSIRGNEDAEEYHRRTQEFVTAILADRERLRQDIERGGVELARKRAAWRERDRAEREKSRIEALDVEAFQAMERMLDARIDAAESRANAAESALSSASATEAALRAEVERVTGERNSVEQRSARQSDLIAAISVALGLPMAASALELAKSVAAERDSLKRERDAAPWFGAMRAAQAEAKEDRAKREAAIMRAEAAESREAALRGERDEACEALGHIAARAGGAAGYEVEGALYETGEIARAVLARIHKETPDHE